MEQLNLFDYMGKQRPCDYNFNRYIGQRVHVMEDVGVIVGIEPYYTHVDNGHCIIAGTPTTCWPMEGEDNG